MWKIHPPFTSSFSKKVDLIISFDTNPSDYTSSQCKKLFECFGFNKIIIISAQLTPEEAIYIRENSGNSKNTPEFGYKSGPNKHWIYNQSYLSGKYSYSLQYETDVIPIKSFWFKTLLDNFDHTWLISGAVYRGPTRLGSDILNHINGNAIYNTSHKDHMLWVKYTEQCIKHAIHQGDHAVAFDTAPFIFLNKFLRGNSMLLYNEISCISNEDDIRYFIQRINYNYKIFNFTGGIELRDQYPIDFDKIILQYAEDSILIHSKIFRFFALAEILINEHIITVSDKKFILKYFKEQLVPTNQKEIFKTKYLDNNPFLLSALEHSFINPILWKRK
jgi:hypothetical protein